MRVLLLGIAVVVLGGCADADSTAQQAGKALASWSSTLQLADAELTQGHVTRIFVRQTVQQALKSTDEQERQLSKLPADQPRRTQLQLRAIALRQQAQHLSQRTGHPEPRS